LAAFLDRREPADTAALRELGVALGIVWPHEFVELMSITNGGEGWVGESYLSVYELDQIARFNSPEFHPGLVLFGSDGGGEGFAFRKSSTPPDIVMANLVGPDPAIPQGDLSQFTDRLIKAAIFDPLGSPSA
jgi:hypothetical protein